MRVAFLTPSLSRAAGGIFEIERGLALALAADCHLDVEIYGLRDEFTLADEPQWRPLQIRHFAVRGPRAFHFSPALRAAFLRSEADIAHLHALWTYPSVLLCEWARRRGRPYVVTLNGMLEPWALANSRIKKTIAAWLYENAMLRHAACIQVNSEAELASARGFGLSNPVAIVANGVAPPDLGRAVDLDAGELGALRRQGRKILLFLGRIHRKKGLPNLLQALGRVPANNWVLAIAGWQQEEHEAELRVLATSLGVADRVLFLGPCHGDRKDLVLRQADAFILPSFSEGLPMAVLEAWAYGKPVAMTPGCNLPIGFEARAAIRIEPAADSIAEGLERLFAMSDAERDAMGRRGRQLAETRFSWSSVAGEISSVYHWALQRSPPPGCIKFDRMQ